VKKMNACFGLVTLSPQCFIMGEWIILKVAVLVSYRIRNSKFSELWLFHRKKMI